MITRAFVSQVESRLRDKHPRLQVVLGPRQVGKTTGVQQLLKKSKGPTHYASADDVLVGADTWVQSHWQTALQKGAGTLLVLDEIQKIPRWAETVKRLWDAGKSRPPLRCVLLGSSSLRLQRGLTESLAGRFELTTVPHWSFSESQKAFRHTLDTYLLFGGYPGGEPYRSDYPRWFSYIKSSILDMVIGQDILSQQTVTKPALFRQAFEILSGYPAQEISYSKLLGQLQDRGNTDLVKHYLDLYEGAFLFKSLQKYAPRHLTVKSSSPKIFPLCPALHTVAAGPSSLQNPVLKGRVFEAVVGAELLRVPGASIYYWREGKHEVDYVAEVHGALFAIEVKSGRPRLASGLHRFRERFPRARTLLLTPDTHAEFSADPLSFIDHFSL